MIKLSNNHKLSYLVASGALGFDGKGYIWEWPFRWLGFLRPEEFTIITKTLTFEPRKGNLKWYIPWQSVKILKKGIINSVGLTNPGIDYWIKKIYPTLKYKTIVSICPFTLGEATVMSFALNDLNICGVEVNLSCPNLEQCSVEILNEVVDKCKHPVIVKLGHNAVEFVRAYQEHKGKKVEAFDLINSVPWKVVSKAPSPLRDCSGVSGEMIKELAREALIKVQRITTTPIIAGGGVDSINEVYVRRVMGARAISFGTLFLRKPWQPNRIVSECKRVGA